MELFKISVEPLEPFLEDKSNLTEFFTLNQLSRVGEYLEKIHKSDLTKYDVKTQKVKNVTPKEVKRIFNYIAGRAEVFLKVEFPIQDSISKVSPYDIISICRVVSLFCEFKPEVENVKDSFLDIVKTLNGTVLENTSETFLELLNICCSCDLETVFSRFDKSPFLDNFKGFFEIYFKTLKF